MLDLASIFGRKREATIQFSDVFGAIPSSHHYDASWLQDFDASLTAQVRNTGKFVDAQFSIGYWPELGDYGAVLLEELRTLQLQQIRERFGPHFPTDDDIAHMHPDEQAECVSVQKALIAVINCAPRRTDHHASGANGDEFYVGCTTSGIEVYAQLNYFRGLAARGMLTDLYRIPNDSGVWKPGEQFRSSCVSRVRANINCLEPADIGQIQAVKRPYRVAYADKFGNVRIECLDMVATRTLLTAQTKVNVSVGNAPTLLVAHVVKRLTEIPEGELGIYENPTERAIVHGPGYIELVRRVTNPNGHAEHAYITLIREICPDVEAFHPVAWRKVDLQLSASVSLGNDAAPSATRT